MHSFKKLPDGSWGVFSETGQTGQTVTVTKRDGGTSVVELGAQVAPQLFALAPRAPRAAAAPVAVGDLSGIIAMFATAARHLRYPAIVLDGFRVSVAGRRAAQPGSLTVTGLDKVHNSFRGRDERPWFGRVSTAGEFQPGQNAPAGLAEKLRRFAADPAREAAAHGHLTGRCCFCNCALTDERSTGVGYGPDCADHFGLPWGARAGELVVQAEVAA